MARRRLRQRVARFRGGASSSSSTRATRATARTRSRAARTSRASTASRVTLADGRTVVADESYIRESIVAPNAKLVAGFQPLMPTFQGLISEEGLLQLVAYVKSLSKAGPSPAGIPPPVQETSPEKEVRE